MVITTRGKPLTPATIENTLEPEPGLAQVGGARRPRGMTETGCPGRCPAVGVAIGSILLTTALAATLVVASREAVGQPGAAPSMVRIEGGAYPIGDDAGPPEARPAHTVTLAPFLIDRFEVTNAEFAAFLATLDVRPRRDAPAGAVTPADVEGPHVSRLFTSPRSGPRQALFELDDDDARIGIMNGRFAPAPGYERHPVVEVTWAGAVAFCARRGARLPTEVEWEAAARGREGRVYPWGDGPPAPERAVYGSRRRGETEPVGSRPAGATPEGVQDLAGNVAEWTSTLYRPYPYDPRDGREDPRAPGERVTRGGDYVFDSAPDKLLAARRAGFSRAPDAGHRHIGFRCARSG